MCFLMSNPNPGQYESSHIITGSGFGESSLPARSQRAYLIPNPHALELPVTLLKRLNAPDRR